MSVVPRWTILRTTLKQNVAEHSFFVVVYSFLVAEAIDWNGPRDYLMMNSAMHDNDETVSGDITGTIKNVLLDKEAAEEFLTAKTEERMGGLIDAYYKLEDRQSEKNIREADAIVLVADKLEGVLFLVDNAKMGNSHVHPAIAGGMKSLEAAWRALPSDKDTLDRLWQTTVLTSISEHYERGGRGVAPGVYI